MERLNPKESIRSRSDRSANETSKMAQSLLKGLLGKWMVWTVLIASLLATFTGWYLAREERTRRVHDRFDFHVRAVQSSLHEHLQACELLLRGCAGLFAASDEVTRSEWRTYVNKLEIEQYYPGIQGVGFSMRILPSEKSSHISEIRAEGFPAYTITPDGERPEYTSIVYLEPFDWRNQRAFGYDMTSEPVRREAMSRARDTGLATMSGKVTLVQETNEDVQAGFLIYLPVYRKTEPTETPEQRRDALVGYVYSPFRMVNFIRDVLAEQEKYVELDVFDGEERHPANLMFRGSAKGGSLQPSGPRYPITHQSVFEYAGHRWLLVFESSPRYEETIFAAPTDVVLVLGILSSLLLFACLSSLIRSRNQAVTLAGITLEMERAGRGLREEASERKRAERALHRSEKDLVLRDQLNAVFLTHPDETMYGEVLRLVLLQMNSEFGTFGYFDEDGSFVAPALSRNVYWDRCNVPDKEIIFKKGTFSGIWGMAIKERRAIFSNDGPFRTPQGHVPINNTMAAPIIFQDQVISALHVANKPDGYDEDDLKTIEMISDLIAPVLHARLHLDKRDQERKQAEAALRTSLAEKEVLLKEVHHRVKNNLAAIIGLVDMQGQTLGDEPSRTALAELNARIRSIAFVHEQLYQSADLSRIEFQDYIEALIPHLRSSYERSWDVGINLNATGIQVGLDIAVPCGLLVTELVTNALKYAFPAGRPHAVAEGCQIVISIEEDGASYVLTVADNGVGLPSDLDWLKTKTLGLQLVRMLGQHQLRGRIEWDRTAGTTFRLRFAPKDALERDPS
jgi:two-component sensor histidine kinase/CHASE1-domain containing sensor protein